MDKSLSFKIESESSIDEEFEIDSSKFKEIVKQYKSQINNLKEEVLRKEADIDYLKDKIGL